MKKNGLLFLGLAALAVGAYFLLKGRPATGRPVQSTGSATTPQANWLDALINRGGFAQTARTTSPGASGGAYDSSVAAGISVLGGLAKRAIDALLGKDPSPAGSPASNPYYGTPSYPTSYVGSATPYGPEENPAYDSPDADYLAGNSADAAYENATAGDFEDAMAGDF